MPVAQIPARLVRRKQKRPVPSMPPLACLRAVRVVGGGDRVRQDAQRPDDAARALDLFFFGGGEVEGWGFAKEIDISYRR